jgi:hypothetical protein
MRANPLVVTEQTAVGGMARTAHHGPRLSKVRAAWAVSRIKHKPRRAEVSGTRSMPPRHGAWVVPPAYSADAPSLSILPTNTFDVINRMTNALQYRLNRLPGIRDGRHKTRRVRRPNASPRSDTSTFCVIQKIHRELFTVESHCKSTDAIVSKGRLHLLEKIVRTFRVDEIPIGNPQIIDRDSAERPGRLWRRRQDELPLGVEKSKKTVSAPNG